jgi:hypothetical protein
MAPSPQRALCVPIHVCGSRIHKDQIQNLIKQISVLKIKLSLQRLPKIRKKTHTTIKMPKLNLLKPRSLYCPHPTAPLQITARFNEPLQTQSKAHPLQIEFQTPALHQGFQNPGNSLPLPESSKDQSGPPEFGRTRINIGNTGGFYHPQSLRETAETLNQSIELPLGPKPIQTSEGDKDALADRSSLSIRLYNLHIIMGMSLISTTFNSNKHTMKLSYPYIDVKEKVLLYGTTFWAN